MLFVCHPKILHKHRPKFLLGVKMAQEKLKTMLMQKFGMTNKENYGMLRYFLEWSILCGFFHFSFFSMTPLQLAVCL